MSVRRSRGLPRPLPKAANPDPVHETETETETETESENPPAAPVSDDPGDDEQSPEAFDPGTESLDNAETDWPPDSVPESESDTALFNNETQGTESEVRHAPTPPGETPSLNRRRFRGVEPAPKGGETETTEAQRYEKMYTMIMDSIPSSIVLIDPQLKIRAVNANFLHKARVRAGDVVGLRMDAVFPPVMYEHMNLRNRVLKVFREGEPQTGERMLYKAPGLPPRVFYYRLIPFRWEGRVELVMLLLEDVTETVRLGEEARRAERHLASVVEAASDLVLSMDTSGRVRTWNSAAVRITGWQESEVLERRLPELCAEDQRAGLANILENLPRLSRSEPCEVEILTRDGGLAPVSWIFSLMKDERGETVGFVGIGRDLTERRELQDQLIRAEKLAALGVMAGGIAHEVRNPLAVVSCAAQMLLEGRLSPEVQRECAERIHRGVQRASNIIESLLRFARPGPGDSTRGQTVDLPALARDTALLTANQFHVMRVQLLCDLPDSLTGWVRGNANLLRQVIMNLLLNAAHAVENANPGIVSLRGEIRRDEIVLQVSDNGRGIPEADLPKVFDPFFTTRPVGQGTGLGLSICYAIVAQHQGQIDITSSTPGGTVVTVSFPRVTKESETENEPENEPESKFS